MPQCSRVRCAEGAQRAPPVPPSSRISMSGHGAAGGARDGSDDPSRLPGLVDPRSGGVQHAEGTRGAPVSDAEREELEERMAMGKISHCMASYRSIAGAENARQRWNISRLPEHRRTLLPGLATRVADMQRCVGQNAELLDAILDSFDPVDDRPIPSHLADARRAARDWATISGGTITHEDAGKVHYLLKNIYRDWSVEGAAERAESYGPIVAEVCRLFGPDRRAPATDQPATILCPGCGLGRLPIELACQGFDAQGNEFNYYLLLTSSFFMNNDVPRGYFEAYPWVLQTCNNPRASDPFLKCTVPDLEPAAALPVPGLLSMCAGGFVEVYANSYEDFDCVASCFFLDTAHDIVEYLEVIHRCLKPGGYLVNLGPLMYHWYGDHREMSLEISLEEVLHVAGAVGFDIDRHAMHVAGYTNHPATMFRTAYNCAFTTFRKARTLYGAVPRPVLPAEKDQEDAAEAITSRA